MTSPKSIILTSQHHGETPYRLTSVLGYTMKIYLLTSSFKNWMFRMLF